jgi:microcompartment protein CcmL/EutN
MDRAIATLELISVARGYLSADAMLKSGNVNLLFSSPICPGKYLIVIGGQVGAVKNALAAGSAVAEEALADSMIIPNVHPDIFPAISCATVVESVESLGIVETMSAPAAIEAADAAAKAAKIQLIEIRLGRGMGAKSAFTYTGDVSEAKTAAAAARNVVEAKGLLVDVVVIPRPHPDLKSFVL